MTTPCPPPHRPVASAPPKQRAALLRPKRHSQPAGSHAPTPHPAPPVWKAHDSPVFDGTEFTPHAPPAEFAAKQVKPPRQNKRRTPPSPAERALMPAFATLPDAQIHIPATHADFAQARQQLLAASALGFDTESKPLFLANQKDSGPHLVQLATPEAAWLLQLHHPEAVALAQEVMGNPGILKVGFGLDNDRRSLPHRLGGPLNNVVDLDRQFSQLGYGRNLGVRGAVAVVMKQDFRKSKKTSTSNWAARTLNESQRRYAANDAHAPAVLWWALPAWLRQLEPGAQAFAQERTPPGARQ